MMKINKKKRPNFLNNTTQQKSPSTYIINTRQKYPINYIKTKTFQYSKNPIRAHKKIDLTGGTQPLVSSEESTPVSDSSDVPLIKSAKLNQQKNASEPTAVSTRRPSTHPRRVRKSGCPTPGASGGGFRGGGLLVNTFIRTEQRKHAYASACALYVCVVSCAELRTMKCRREFSTQIVLPRFVYIRAQMFWIICIVYERVCFFIVNGDWWCVVWWFFCVCVCSSFFCWIGRFYELIRIFLFDCLEESWYV